MIVAATEPASLRDLTDRAGIIDTKIRYATGIDRRDWATYRSIFTDEVERDFTSWSGGQAETVRADDWVAGVTATLSGFDATQHVFTNFVVALEGDAATLVTSMSAHHHLVEDGERKMHSIGGFYTEQFVRAGAAWKIRACRLTVTWEMGDRGLFQKARARWAAKG